MPHLTELTEAPTTPGLYLITCVATGLAYAGLTTRNIRRITTNYRSRLRGGTHWNARFQADYLEHGEAAFTVRVLSDAEDLGVLKREQRAVAQRHEENGGTYNHVPALNQYLDAGPHPGRRTTLWDRFIRPDGTPEPEFKYLNAFCERRNLDYDNMRNLHHGRIREYRGWTARRDPPV